MIGILLAAGAGTRLRPITKVCNKLILPVFNQPMIFYPLTTLLNSGIKEIAVVVSTHKEQIQEIIEEFPQYARLKISFVVQHKLLGMADAIRCTKSKVGGESIFVIAGDNLYQDDFKEEVRSFKNGALSFLRKVKDPHRFGVPVYKGKELVKIIEKPENPKTNWVVTGPHLFDSNVFSYIKALKPSSRGELEITDLNGQYIEKGLLKLKKRQDYWTDAGTFDSLLDASIKISKSTIKP